MDALLSTRTSRESDRRIGGSKFGIRSVTSFQPSPTGKTLQPLKNVRKTPASVTLQTTG